MRHKRLLEFLLRCRFNSYLNYLRERKIGSFSHHKVAQDSLSKTYVCLSDLNSYPSSTLGISNRYKPHLFLPFLRERRALMLLVLVQMKRMLDLITETLPLR
jgi:hypothetical protein